MPVTVKRKDRTPGEGHLADLLAYDALRSGKGRSFPIEYEFDALVVAVNRHFNAMEWWDFSTRGKDTEALHLAAPRRINSMPGSHSHVVGCFLPACSPNSGSLLILTLRVSISIKLSLSNVCKPRSFLIIVSPNEERWRRPSYRSRPAEAGVIV
jgi:hypothetical protein